MKVYSTAEDTCIMEMPLIWGSNAVVSAYDSCPAAAALAKSQVALINMKMSKCAQRYPTTNDTANDCLCLHSATHIFNNRDVPAHAFMKHMPVLWLANIKLLRSSLDRQSTHVGLLPLLLLLLLLLYAAV
jgi:hypothetical protein